MSNTIYVLTEAVQERLTSKGVSPKCAACSKVLTPGQIVHACMHALQQRS